MDKNNLKELDVDFIGGEGTLTKEEEKRISEFLKMQKLLRLKQQKASTRSKEQKKEKA